MKRLITLRLISFLLCALLSVALCAAAYYRDDSFALIFANTGYYFMLVLFALWCCAIGMLASSEVFRLQDWINTHRLGILFCAVLVASIFFAIKPGYKVLSDETNLVSVSRSMTYDKKIYNTLMGRYYFDDFHKIREELPTRPLLYPFLVSLVHSVVGYHYKNAFYTNGILGFLLLLLIYGLIARAYSVGLGIALILLIASQPLFGLCITSAGFEIPNLLFITLSCILAFAYARKQSNERFTLLWYTLIMSSHVRYENPLYMAVIFATLLFHNKLPFKQLLDNAHHVGLGVLLLVPRYWQSLTAEGNYENGGQALLDLQRAPGRLGEYLDAMLNIDYRLPYATATNILVFSFFIFAIIDILRRRRHIDTALRIFVITISLCCATYTVIVSSHFLANAVHPAVYRLFLLPTLIFTASILFAFRYLNAYSKMILMVSSALLFIMYNPIAIHQELTKSLTLIRSTKEIYGLLERLNDPRITMVIDRPGQYTVLDMGAVDHAWANEHGEELLEGQEKGLHTKILVVQEVSYLTKQPAIKMHERFHLEPLYEFQNDATTKIVISEATRQKPKS